MTLYDLSQGNHPALGPLGAGQKRIVSLIGEGSDFGSRINPSKDKIKEWEFETVSGDRPAYRVDGGKDVKEAITLSYRNLKKDELPLGSSSTVGELGGEVRDWDFSLGGKRLSQSDKQVNFEHGQTALGLLRQRYPDNKLYKMANTVDVETGELVLPKFDESDFVSMLRNHPVIGPANQTVSDSRLLTRAFAANPDLRDMVYRASDPSGMDVLAESAQVWGNLHILGAQGLTSTWNGIMSVADWVAWGVDKTAEAFGGDTGYIPLQDYKEGARQGSLISSLLAPDRWSKAVEEQRIKEHNFKLKYDPEYREYQMWVENSPAWDNLGDPRIWARSLTNTLPSLAATYGTGGLAFKGARILGATRDAAFKASFRASASTGVLLETGSYMQNAVTYSASDRKIGREEYEGELAKWEEDMLEQYHIKDDLSETPSFGDRYKAGDDVIKENMTLSEFNKRKQAYLEENFDLVGTEIYMKGLDVSDAMDANIGGALIYGSIAGVLEGLTASRAIKMLPDGWGPTMFRESLRGKTVGRITSAMRRIPGVNKLSRIPDNKFLRIFTQAGAESMEEVAQYTSEALISSGISPTAYKPEFDWNFDEAFESALGGFLGGATVTTVINLGQSTGVPDYYANKRAISEKGPGREYYSKKAEDGSWGIYTSVEGKETQLKVGDGQFAGDKDSFTSFRGANKVAKKLRYEQRAWEDKQLLRNWKNVLVDTKVGDVTYNEETEQYEVEIVSKETGERVKLENFDSRVEAKTYKRNVESNQKYAESIKNKYTDEDIQAQDVMYGDKVDSDQKTADNTLLIKSYLSNVELTKEEKKREEILEEQGAFNEDVYLNNMLDALNDEQALKDSGADREALVNEFRQDYGDSVADDIAEKLIMKGPEIQTGPEAQEEGPPQSSSRPTPADQRPPESNVKAPDEMNLAELRQALKEVEAKAEAKGETPFTNIRKKYLKKLINKRKGKIEAKTTVSSLNKKDFKKKVSKFKDKQAKKIFNNLLIDKEDILDGVEAVDSEILKKGITWVSDQKFMGDEWVQNAISKLTEGYNILKAQEDAQKKLKKEDKKVTEDKVSPEILAKRKKSHLEFLKKARLMSLEELRGIAQANEFPNFKTLSKEQILELLEKKEPSPLLEEFFPESDMEEMLKAAAEGTSKHVEGAEDTISPGNYDNINLVSPHIRKLEEEVPEGTIFLDDETRVRVNRLNTPATDDYKDIIFTLNALKSGNPVSTIPMRADDGSSHDSAVLALNQALQAFDRKDYYDAAEKIDKIINDDTVLKFLDDEKYGMAAEKKALYNELTALKQAMGKEPSQRYQEAVEQTNRDAKRKEEVKETIKSIQNAIKDKVLVNGKQIKFKYVDKPEVDKRGWYDKGVVTINLAYADSTTLFHEVMHPFAESLYVNNKELFDTIYAHLLTDDIGKKVRKKVLGPKKEAPDMIEGVSKLHKNKTRGNLSISRESEVKSIFNEMRKVASLIKNTKNRVKSNSTIDEAEIDYFAGRYGDANAKVEKAIMLLHEQAEFTYPDYKVNEDGSIVVRMPGFAWGEPGGTEQILGKDASKEVGGWGLDESDPLTKVEILVEAIAIAALAKKPKKTGGIAQAIRRFFKWLKSIFFPKAAHKKEYQITEKTTFKDIADMLTNYQAEDFIPVDYNKDVQAVFEKIEGVARFQPMEPSKATKREARYLFKNAWKDVQRILKKNNLAADPFDFSSNMVSNIPRGVLRDYFHDWFYSEFENHPHLKYRAKHKGENSGFIADPDIVRGHVTEIFNDENYREGLQSLIEENGQDERDVGISEQIWMEELGFTLRKGTLENLKRKARKSLSFESFAKEILPSATNNIVKIYDRYGKVRVNKRQLAMTKRFYYRINSYIRTNQPKGKGNLRDSYAIKKRKVKGADRFELILKDGVNIKTGNQNPYAEKITLHENNVKKQLISWLSHKDYYEVSRKEDKKKRISETIEDPYGFFKAYELKEIEEIANAKDLTIVFSRGESRKIGFTRITDTHKSEAKNIDNYVDKEVKAGYVPNKKVNKDAFKTAADIAAHEAMKSIWPMYLYDTKGAANNMKRIKIPLTPVTISKDMPEFKFKIFDADKASFVDTNTGKVTDAVQNIRGVGRKYIMDGGTLASRDMFNRLVEYGGVLEGSGSSKNVIHHTEAMNTVMVKHEMNRTPRNIEVWYNKGQAGEQLVAKVDNRGDITDAEGNPLDLLMTPDEAKVYDGYDIDAVHTVPGQSIGFISYRDKVSSTSTHALQWYNYVSDPKILQAFKDKILPKVNSQFANIWDYSVDTRDSDGKIIPGKSSADKIEKLLVDVLESADNEGFRHTMTELAKVGAGMHQGLEPMLDQIVQNKRINKTVRVGYQPGSRLKITGNLRGDLKENEIAIGKQNASAVYQAYSKAHDDMSIADVKKEGIDKINKWLESNEVNVTTVRFPVPHEGGMLLTRIKRLHNRKGMIEMHPVDVFAKLEGDMDGDEVQIESLTPEHEALVKDYLDKLDIKGINLKDYVSSKRDSVLFTDQKARFELMDALFYGETAIGEIANVMNVVGQLSQVFDHAVIDGRKIVIKSLDEFTTFQGKKMKVRQVLRTYLQAALDNAEFMLLKGWNYDVNSMYQAIFKRADGKPFRVQTFYKDGVMYKAHQRERVFNALKPLIDIHKKAGHIRKGFDFENGRYKASDTIRESDRFLFYTENRKRYAKEGNHGENKQGFINDIVFKEDAITSPWEDVAIAPARTMREHVTRHERTGLVDGGTVFQLNDLIHQNAHLDSLVSIDKIKSEILESAYNQDVKNNIAIGDKKLYLQSQERIAGVYRTSMGNAWFQALLKVDKMGASTIDRNANVVDMTNEWDAKFKDLSKSAKVMATFKFLQGFLNISNALGKKKYDKFGKVRIIKALPPVSKSKSELQLLDEGVLSKFFKEYNKIVGNIGNRTLKNKSKSRDYTSMDEIIKRICE